MSGWLIESSWALSLYQRLAAEGDSLVLRLSSRLLLRLESLEERSHFERTNKRRSVDSVFSQPSLLPQQTAAGVCYLAAQGSALDERGPAGLHERRGQAAGKIDVAVVATRQLTACGIDSDAVAVRVRRGQLHRVQGIALVLPRANTT